MMSVVDSGLGRRGRPYRFRNASGNDDESDGDLAYDDRSHVEDYAESCSAAWLRDLARRTKKAGTATKVGNAVNSAADIQPKKRKRLVEDDYLCPITHFLPYDPVMAEDGRIYERSAIEEYFRGKPDGQVTSPMTGVVMSKRLISALQTKNAVEALIENGVITGELAVQWIEQDKKVKKMQGKEALMEKAEQGDVEAMLHVADNFFAGDEGFDEDCEEAHKWYRNAHLAGSIIGTAEFGENLVEGCGVKLNEQHGLVHLGLAAAKGSDKAAYVLGVAFAAGQYGLPVDKAKAIEFLQLALNENSAYPHMCEDDKIDALEKLMKS